MRYMTQLKLSGLGGRWTRLLAYIDPSCQEHSDNNANNTALPKFMRTCMLSY